VFIIETEGVAMNSLSRAELMAKLAAREPHTEHESPRPIAVAASVMVAPLVLLF
jgi:hypothetical protein